MVSHKTNSKLSGAKVDALKNKKDALFTQIRDNELKQKDTEKAIEKLKSNLSTLKEKHKDLTSRYRTVYYQYEKRSDDLYTKKERQQYHKGNKYIKNVYGSISEIKPEYKIDKSRGTWRR